MILDHIFYLLKQNDEETLDIFWSWITRRNYGDLKLEKINGRIENLKETIYGSFTEHNNIFKKKPHCKMR